MRRDDLADDAPGRLVVAPQGHLAYVPDPLPPRLDLGWGTINTLVAAERALGELEGVGQRLPNPHLLISPFLRREAVLSSRIEGTTSGLEQLFLFEAAPFDEAEDPESQDVLEVANYVAALELGLARLDAMPVCLRLILDVHARLLQGVRGQDRRPGEFRDAPNLIGRRGATPETARFVPPPVREMHAALHDLERYIGDRRDDLPVLIQLAVIHYQFETIHPFMDGNGRLGRLLIALLLKERNYLSQPLLYLSAYFERYQDRYRDHLLDVSLNGTWVEWIDFFLTGVVEQARDTTRKSHQLVELWQDYHARAVASSNSANLLKLVDLLFERPILTVRNAQDGLGVTSRSAGLLVERLVGLGVLEEITGQRRNRRFAAREILGIVSGFDAHLD